MYISKSKVFALKWNFCPIHFRHSNRVPIRSRSHEQTKKIPSSSHSNFPAPNYDRGLVPQLWANYTAPTETPAENVSCNTARFECSKRAGCQMALTSYAMYCTVLVPGPNERKSKRRSRGKSRYDYFIFIYILIYVYIIQDLQNQILFLFFKKQS